MAAVKLPLSYSVFPLSLSAVSASFKLAVPLAERHYSATETPISPLVPTARGIAGSKDAETAERERGNTEYECGNFTAAIKSYTKCLGLKVCKVYLTL